MKKHNFLAKELSSELSEGRFFASTMMTVSVFLLGFLLLANNEVSEEYRAPILLLLTAFFSSLLAFVIYTNAGAYLVRLRDKKTEVAIIKHIEAGNLLSEFTGLYLILLAAPIAIQSSTDDGFLKASIAIITLLSIIIYTLSNFALVSRYTDRIGQALFTVMLVAYTVTMLTDFLDSGVKLVVTICLLCFFALLSFILYLQSEHDH